MPRTYETPAKFSYKTAMHHLDAADILRYSNNPFALFSMGFICHLIIELMMKAIIVDEKSTFSDEHNL